MKFFATVVLFIGVFGHAFANDDYYEPEIVGSVSPEEATKIQPRYNEALVGKPCSTNITTYPTNDVPGEKINYNPGVIMDAEYILEYASPCGTFESVDYGCLRNMRTLNGDLWLTCFNENYMDPSDDWLIPIEDRKFTWYQVDVWGLMQRQVHASPTGVLQTRLMTWEESKLFMEQSLDMPDVWIALWAHFFP